LARTTLDLGEYIGAIERDEDDCLRLSANGVLIGYPMDDRDPISEEGFREALRGTPTYRSIIERILNNELIENVRGKPVVSQSALIEAGEHVTGDSLENRHVNVLIKSLEQAGLGEYRVGRKGVETRLIISGGKRTMLERVCSRERTASPELARSAHQPRIQEYAPPSVSTSIQIDLDGFGSNQMAELLREIEDLVEES
jgi:hypothetical protein